MPWKSRLAVDYNPEIPAPTLQQMERHGRRMGLELEVLELLTEDPDVCDGFVRHAEKGAADLFLRELDFDQLRGLRAARRSAHATPAFDDGAFVVGL